MPVVLCPNLRCSHRWCHFSGVVLWARLPMTQEELRVSTTLAPPQCTVFTSSSMRFQLLTYERLFIPIVFLLGTLFHASLFPNALSASEHGQCCFPDCFFFALATPGIQIYLPCCPHCFATSKRVLCPDKGSILSPLRPRRHKLASLLPFFTEKSELALLLSFGPL